MLEVKNITKYFPGVRALNDVSCKFKEGEIHALLGENGAGKSTLMKIVCGTFKQDNGEVWLDGKAVHFSNYEDALLAGVAVVNQEIQIIPDASVAENIMLNNLSKYRKRAGIDWNLLNSDAKELLELVGLDISPNHVAGALTVSQKQLIQIAKALNADAKYIILDEPTASLSTREIDNLFEILRKLRDEGKGLIFISHKLEEILILCDNMTVLRDGCLTGSRSCEGLKKEEIVEMMIGRKSSETYLGELDIDYDDVVLEVKHLKQEGRFEDINFKLYKGEILGFYGLVGAGRTELMRAIFGADKLNGGEIFVNGQKVKIRNVTDAVYKHGLGYVSENRKEEGLILDFSLEDNISINIWHKIKRFCKFGPINKKTEANKVLNIFNYLKIKAHGPRQIVNTLSGGNQQKVSIAKWLACETNILIIDEPTVGVDVGAKEVMHQLIWDIAKKQKKAVILISSELPEMIKLARRIFVYKDNRIVAELENKGNVSHESREKLSRKIGSDLT